MSLPNRDGAHSALQVASSDAKHFERVAELAQAGRRLYDRVLKLREYSSLWGSLSTAFESRVGAFAHLLVEALSSQSTLVHDLAHADAELFFDSVNEHIARIRSCKTTDASARIRQESIDHLLEFNLVFGNSYLWHEEQQPHVMPDYHANGSHIETLLRRVVAHLSALFQEPQDQDWKPSATEVLRTSLRTLRKLECGDERGKHDARSAVVDIEIYLPGKHESDLEVQPIEDAVTQLVHALGATTSLPIETRYGSIRRRIIAFFSTTTPREAQTAYEVGKEALRNSLVEKPRSEVLENVAEAAARVISSLDNVDNAVVRVGELIVVKRTTAGVASIAVETISAQMAQILEKTPSLIKQPDKLFDLLASQLAEVTSELLRLAESG